MSGTIALDAYAHMHRRAQAAESEVIKARRIVRRALPVLRLLERITRTVHDYDCDAPERVAGLGVSPSMRSRIQSLLPDAERWLQDANRVQVAHDTNRGGAA